ncbi:MAG: Prolyl aminopeptidase [Bacteroidetes bacterium]|nr:Prolyl aminopeptidase [Bacteroidota bacterium]
MRTKQVCKNVDTNGKMTRYIIILVALIFSSFVYIQTGKNKEQFVEIRGKKQFYISKGVGEPVVVFITGLGPTMDDFQIIQNKISKSTRAICYNRAGIGNSESFNNDRTLQNIASELKEMADALSLNKPFILVGHSRGALIARYFVSQYPQKVCGLILIDPAIPEHKSLKRQLRTNTEKTDFDKLYNSFCTDSTKYSATIRNEFRNTFTTDSSLVSGKGFPLNIPITIIASNKITQHKYSIEETKIKVDLLKSYLKINPQIKLIFTDKSGHFIYDTEPTLVIREIAAILDNIKTNKKQ